MEKEVFTAARKTIGQIEDLLVKAKCLLDTINPDITDAIGIYHNERVSLRNCIHYGLQATKDIREDWHAVVADIPCKA